MSWTVAFAFQEHLQSSKQPILFAAPNWFTEQQMMEAEVRFISTISVPHSYTKRTLGLGAPYACVKYAAELALLAAGRTSGIVVEGGEIVSTVVAVWNGKLLRNTMQLVPFALSDIEERRLSESDAIHAFMDEGGLGEGE